MQFVEDDELKTVGVLDDLRIQCILPGQEKLGHHEIGQQDIRRMRGNLLPGFPGILPGVSPDNRPERRRNVRLLDEPLDFLELTIGERVHRIHDDRACPGGLAGFARPDDCIDDRDEETEGLSRAGARGDDETVAGTGLGDGLALVPVKQQRFRSESEHAGRFRAQVS